MGDGDGNRRVGTSRLQAAENVGDVDAAPWSIDTEENMGVVGRRGGLRRVSAEDNGRLGTATRQSRIRSESIDMLPRWNSIETGVDRPRPTGAEEQMDGFRGLGGRMSISSGAYGPVAARGSDFDSLYDMTPRAPASRHHLPVPRTATPMPSSPPPVGRPPIALSSGPPRVPSPINISSKSRSEGDEDESEDEEVDDTLGPFDARVQGRMRYDYAIKKSCVDAIMLARMHAEQLGHPLATDILHEEWRIMGTFILWSMPHQLLMPLIAGNIAKEAEMPSSPLGELFGANCDWMAHALDGSPTAPVIYSIVLCSLSPDRAAPSAREWGEVIQMLARYASLREETFEDALDIDNAFRGRSDWEDICDGKHFFLSKEQDGVRKRVRGRVEIVKQFCSALEQRLQTVAEQDMDEPLARAHAYIGYAFHLPTRWKSHQAGTSAFLLHLVHAAFQVLFKDTFGLQCYPLCFLAQPEEARLAELLLTLLADSFASTGGGFNAHPPGLNNASVDTKGWSMEKVGWFWGQHREWREKSGFWEAARIKETPILANGGVAASEPFSEASHGTQQARRDAVKMERERLEAKLSELQEKAEQARQHALQQVVVKPEVDEDVGGGAEVDEALTWMQSNVTLYKKH